LAVSINHRYIEELEYTACPELVLNKQPSAKPVTVKTDSTIALLSKPDTIKSYSARSDTIRSDSARNPYCKGRLGKGCCRFK